MACPRGTDHNENTATGQQSTPELLPIKRMSNHYCTKEAWFKIFTQKILIICQLPDDDVAYKHGHQGLQHPIFTCALTFTVSDY